MSVKMTRYKHAEIEEDSCSFGSVHLTEGVSAMTTHIRYHAGYSIWKSRSVLEKCLIVSSGVLLLVVIIMGFLLGSKDDNVQSILVSQGSGYCLSESCVSTAASMLSSMKPEADPCNDFYEYACGSFGLSNPLPDSKGAWGMFQKLEQKIQLVLKNALQKPITDLKSEAEVKAKKYYLSCMDKNETVETLGATPLLKLIRKIGGWNVSGEFDVDQWDLQKTLQIVHNKYNMGGLFYWMVAEDDKNSSRHVIQVDQTGLSLPTRDSYLNSSSNHTLLFELHEYMTKIGVLLGGEESSVRQQMQSVIDLETRIAEITTPDEDRRDEEKLYHKMSVKELQNKAPFIRWEEYFSNAINFRKVNSSEIIVVYAPEYLSNLTNIINEFQQSEDGKIVLNNYLVWQTVRSMTPYLSKAFRDAYKGLRKMLSGSEEGEEPWRYCVSDTNNIIGFALGALYIRETFHKNSKPMAEKMINDIKTAFKKNMHKLDWMDKKTLKLAEVKVDAITDMIGYPDFIMNPQALDDKYKDLTIREDEYFQNNVRSNQFMLKQNVQRLDFPVNKTRWSMAPHTVNAYYTPNKNQMVFPAGILQAPFFDAKQHQALNFGAVGVVMGHELTHAFDDQGREYDPVGNMKQWWQNDTISRFKKQANCFVDQYKNYQVFGKHINGKRTLGENIADNGGLRAAYSAYETWASKNPPELPLPALNLSPKQLFFLGFAQVWCTVSTNESLNLQIEKDTHSPASLRVTGTLSNLPEFAKAYNCKLGSKMNPVNKCEIW
ncbi:endothelin-converting enzyme homolog isoform X2 [Bemisia tabaci]|uniref:endothelin-converting enzyme homolog isoform X2 n=1 Tax=Bemisia tabaci TaxID=7038 RepID=UPI003B282B24